MKTRSFRAKPQMDGNKFSGYAATFNTWADITENGRSFKEVIRPGAFARTLKENPDVRLLFNHNPENLLARATAGTLRLMEDENGLKFEADIPDTQLGKDCKTLIERGDLDGCSFGFTVHADNWSEEGCELLDVNLMECSIVTWPAYESTSVGVRSKTWEEDLDTMRKKLWLLENA